VAKRYHKEIDGEFKQKVMAKAYRDGLEQQKLDVLNIVKVEEGTLAAWRGRDHHFHDRHPSGIHRCRITLASRPQVAPTERHGRRGRPT
jgi:hypothetical protein